MFGHSKEIKDLYTAYSEKVQLQEDKKDKKEKGIGLEGSINVPGLGKTIETRKDEKNIKDIKNKLTDKDKEDEKKEDELDLVIKNNKKKKDNNENDVDLDGNPITPNNRGKSIPVTRDGKVKPGFKKSGDTFLSLSGSKEDDKKDDKKDAGKEAGKLAGEILAKKQKEDSDDEKGANEWGPGGQPSASKQIDAYKKGRPSPASFKTNQRQTRELIKKQSKEVYPSVTKQDLNQFNRTKKYTADDGSQVERSTVFTKHYKTGKPLGVMGKSQRQKYDLEAANFKAGQVKEPKFETVPSKFAANKDKPTFQRRDQKLLDKGLKPPTYTRKVRVEDAFDIVLGYLQESGQVDSIDEALYIMMEMDAATIQGIVRDFENLNEEAADKVKDERLEKYGIGHDGSDKKGGSGRRSGKKPKGKTNLQKEDEKKYGKGKSAVDIVRAKIEKKHGKGAIA